MSEHKGFTQIPNAIMLNENISANAKITYATLLFFDRGRGCWASKEFLSKRIGLSKHLIRKALTELVEHKLIHIIKRHHGLTDMIRVNAVKAISKADRQLCRSKAGETLNKNKKENLLEEELAPEKTNEDVNNSKDIDDRSYKDAFAIVNSFKRYDKWIQKTDVSNETDNQVVIDKHLKDYHRQVLLENHKEDLKSNLNKKILMR